MKGVPLNRHSFGVICVIVRVWVDTVAGNSGTGHFMSMLIRSSGSTLIKLIISPARIFPGRAYKEWPGLLYVTCLSHYQNA